ncbi:hypothetical protein PV325_003398 [Microctonus aethiopoides]|nr:hypothetical protein PV325_003398 [Microctonus aethiopoides]KAK0092667.1 hypothetical protein PV326_000889 [Microctonus aethiopoides]
MCHPNGKFPIKYQRNILPLPFLEKIKYDKQRSLSFSNEDMNKKWMNFLYNREHYMEELMEKRELYKEENLRWKLRLQYVREEPPTSTIGSISAGLTLDEKGRVPIPYDLYNFRKYPKISNPSKLPNKNHKAI